MTNVMSFLEVIRQNIAGWYQQTFCFQKCVDNAQPIHLKQIFPPIIWIFTEGESDMIESRLPFKIFSTISMPIGRKPSSQKSMAYV